MKINIFSNLRWRAPSQAAIIASGLFFLSALSTSLANAADYYVATTGSDSNAGSISSPFLTIAKGYAMAAAGDTVYVRGGTYSPSTKLLLNKNGTSGNPIRIFAYTGELPILDGINMSEQWTAALHVTGSWNHVRGLKVMRAPDYGVIVTSTSTLAGSNNTLENLEVTTSGRLYTDGKGIAIFEAAANNLVLNCDSHHNRSTVTGNADGFQMGSTGTGNVLRGNRAWRNADDGFDMWNGAPTTLENNWAWENGYDDSLNRLGDGNGFKLGGHHSGKSSGGHTVRNNAAWRNPGNGFDENGALNAITLDNNTAWSNGPTMPGGVSWAKNFYLPVLSNTLRNNLSHVGGQDVNGTESNNSWNLSVTVSDADFASLSQTIAAGPRGANGALPDTDFLRLASGSDLIDAGTNLGQPYEGAAPDLGAFEYIPSSPPSGNLIGNPGFEQQGTNWTDWGNTSFDTTTKNSGTYSLKVFGEGGRVHTISGMAPSTDYTLTFAGKLSAVVSQACTVGIDFKDSSGNTIASQGVLVSGTSWGNHSLQVTSPSSFATARVWIWKDAGSFDCWMDDLVLEPTRVNLVTNPGFELGSQDWTNWGNSSIVSGTKNSGTYSLKVSGEGGRVQTMQGVTANKTYTLVVAGKLSASVSQACTVGVDFKDSGGNTISSTGLMITGTSWANHTLTVTSPSSFATARVWVWKDAGSFNCWIDDVDFR